MWRFALLEARVKSSGIVGKALRSGISRLRAFAYTSRREQPITPLRRPRVGLALGGGFARGVAHIGVIKTLTEAGIPIDVLAGVSVGAIVAAALARGQPVDYMIEAARTTRWKNLARWKVSRLGLATNRPLEGMLRQVLGCSSFADLKLPLAVVATNLSTGGPMIFTSGDLITAVRASCTFPGLFAPVEYEGHLLVDGVIVGNVPVTPLRTLGAERLISISLGSGGLRHTPRNIFQIIDRAFQIVQNHAMGNWRQSSDVVIEPDVGEFEWNDFERADELIEAGAEAARKALPAIRLLLQPDPEFRGGQPAREPDFGPPVSGQSFLR